MSHQGRTRRTNDMWHDDCNVCLVLDWECVYVDSIGAESNDSWLWKASKDKEYLHNAPPLRSAGVSGCRWGTHLEPGFVRKVPAFSSEE